jgi:Penicillin-insensitive murein endopeptidase
MGNVAQAVAGIGEAVTNAARQAILSLPPIPAGDYDMTAINTSLPSKGFGYGTYGNTNGQYGTAWTIAVVMNLGLRWGNLFPDTPIAVGNISLQGGGYFAPHSTHQNGFDVDFGAFALPGTPEAANTSLPLNYWDANYSRSRTRSFFNLVLKLYPKSNILFNDSVLIGENICSASGGHDDHFHVSFVPN